MADVNHHTPLMGRSLSRRELLVLGAGGAISAMMLSWRATGQTINPSALLDLGKRASGPLSIGYWTGNNQSSGGAAEAALVDATKLAGGDTRLARDDMRLRVHGLYATDPAGLANLDMMTLDVGFEPYHSTAFQAWTFVNGSAPRSSSPISMSMPVDEATGLNLSLVFKTAAMQVPESVTTRFAFGDDAATPKLRAGTYLLGLPGLDGAAPDWREHVMVTEPGQNRASICSLYCYSSDGSHATPAKHPYVMFSVE